MDGKASFSIRSGKAGVATLSAYVVTDDQAALLAYEADSFDFTRVSVGAAKQLKASMPKDTTLIEAQSTRYAWMTININRDEMTIRFRCSIPTIP